MAARRQVVVLSSIDWDTAWQRHQIFAAAFAARGDEVFFVENTGFRNPTWRDLPRVWRRLLNQLFPSAVSGANAIPDGLRVFSPEVLPPTWRLFRALNAGFFLPRLADTLRRAGLREGADCVVYAPTPTMVDLARRLAPGAVLYDCASNFRGHAHAPADLAAVETRLLALADEVVCDSDFLYEQKKAEHPRVTKIHQGVPAAFFSLKPPAGTWDDACYYGTWSADLDERVPDALAAAGLRVTVRGFTKGNAPATGPAVRRHPPVDRDALAKTLEEHEVFILPCRLTPFLMGVIPAKIYECLATGRPVIAAPLPSLKAMSEHVYIAETTEEWVRIAKNLPATETTARRDARIALARAHSTEAEFARFAARLDAARARRAADGGRLDAVLLSSLPWERWPASRRAEAAAWAAGGRPVFILELGRGFARALLDGFFPAPADLPPGVERLAAPLLPGHNRFAREVNLALLAPRLADLLHGRGLGRAVVAVRLGACPEAEPLLAHLKPAFVADAKKGEAATPDALLPAARRAPPLDAASPLPSLLRGLGWIGALFGLAKVSTLLTQIAAGRVLGPEEFGRANLALAAIAYLQIVPMLGFPTAIGKLLAAEEDDERRARFVSTALASFLAWTFLVMPLLAVVHRSLERALGLPPSLYALSLGLAALNAFYVVVGSPLLGLKRFAHRGLVEAVYGFTAPLALAASILLLGADHRSMLTAAGASWALGSLYALWCLRRWLAPAWEKAVLPAVWRYAAVATLNLLAVACVLAPARFALHAAGDAAQVGLFSAYFTASLQVALALLHMLQSVVIPLASDARGQKEAWTLARRWTLPAALAAWLFFGAALVAALAVFGRRYPLNWHWVAMFSAAAAFALLHGVLSALYSARDFSGLRVSVTGGLITGAANILLVIRLAPAHGVAGAAQRLVQRIRVGRGVVSRVSSLGDAAMAPRRAAALLVGAVLAAGAWRILADRAAPSWDDAWYLEVSFRLYHALARGLADFAAQWADAFRTKAPLLSLLPLPLYALIGPSEKAAAFVSLAAHGLTCAFTAETARALWREHARREALAALAAGLVALTPLLYGLSRLFLVESLLAALVAAAAWRVALARRDADEAPRLGLLLGLGLLSKVTYPLFLAGVVWLRRRDLAAHARVAVLVGGALAATWYAFNLPFVLGFAWSAGFGRVASDYAGAGPLAFPGRLCAAALSWPLAGAFALVAAAAAARGRATLDAGSRFALLWLAPLAVFAVGVNAEPRLTAPALPALALLVARVALGFDARAARVAAVSLLLATGGAVFVRETFLSGAAMHWSGGPSSETPWDRASLVSAAAEAAGADGVAALALEDRRLNANNLASAAAARGLGLRFISLGYAQPSAEGALLRLKDRGAGALILVEGAEVSSAPEFLNRANAGVAAAVASGRLPARLTASVTLAAGVTARVYRLTPSI